MAIGPGGRSIKVKIGTLSGNCNVVTRANHCVPLDEAQYYFKVEVKKLAVKGMPNKPPR